MKPPNSKSSISPNKNKQTLSSSMAASSSRSLRNWLELPEDVMALIISRLGAIEILTSVQMVCVTWHNICKDPLMWRAIDMRNDGDHHDMNYDLQKMCRHAVDRSSGSLVDINIEYFGTDELLKYITNSSSGIRRLRLLQCYSITDEEFSELASKLPLLEDLEISYVSLSRDSLEVVGASCPHLKSLKFNNQWYESRHIESDDDALAIAGTMHNLRHLQLFGNKLTNDGLQAILDCCPHLESLDLRQCFNLNMGSKLGRKCVKQIKRLWLPKDSTHDYEFDALINYYDSYDEDSPSGYSDSDFLSDDYEDYEFSYGSDVNDYDFDYDYNDYTWNF